MRSIARNRLLQTTGPRVKVFRSDRSEYRLGLACLALSLESCANDAPKGGGGGGLVLSSYLAAVQKAMPAATAARGSSRALLTAPFPTGSFTEMTAAGWKPNASDPDDKSIINKSLGLHDAARQQASIYYNLGDLDSSLSQVSDALNPDFTAADSSLAVASLAKGVALPAIMGEVAVDFDSGGS